MSFLTAFYASIGILLVGFILNLLSIIGAGDVKFLAALILWIKPTQWAGFFITMSLLGTILCVIELGFAKKLRFFRLFIQKTIKKGKILNKFTFFLRDFNKYPSHLSIWEKPVPYGIAIAGAGLWQLS
jgi:Flp pilus assembly protein protease CpaA